MIVSRANLDDARTVAELEAWIGARPDSTPFHRPAWISAVARGTGQEAMMLVCRHGGGDIAGVLPLNLIHSPLFGRALVSSGFAVDGGILADDAAVAEALAQEFWRLAQVLSCPTAELRGGALPREGWTLKSGVYLNFAKALEADDDAQLLAIPRKHRAEVRKGLDNGLDMEFGRDQRLLDIHYRLYAENVHRLGTPVFPKAMFAEVLATFGADADIALVSKDGAPLTTIFSLYHNGVCMPYWQGATLAARKMRSNEAGYFQLMSHARERGCTHFDFGRSKVGTGPAAWKKTWGWEGEPLTYATRAAEGYDARDINPLSPQYQRKVALWKKLPLPIASFIGPYIARGLG
ncbi:MAG: FemAB family PEP-CTERM system-associated protein [Sphingobium sp.]|nr:FemAB family PEP-CTERM system-associated protein [Sphingobium sp.]MBP6111060.1 FemAB family PEP-CTERM system-associated protein [Sphingobium sp.]MBP8670172.1 FemAB family PEP-CTERM system-associated protein [Sphingobium sp.]MBP9157206.1 FemAB family PEP-CTERM system-associated protein [Sphingobium sp.]MCC6481398.1 FemAB family PEP-CTERM system-associated protein [Sphingomonadaceae bacterium]